MRAKVTLRFLQKCKIAVHRVSEFLIQNESENNWASVNTKHAIEESPSRTWHSWRQVFTVNSITRCNDTDAVRAANARVWLPAVSVILCTQVGLVWQEYLVCYTVNLYGPVITLIYTLLWLKRDHALSYQSRSPPVKLPWREVKLFNLDHV